MDQLNQILSSQHFSQQPFSIVILDLTLCMILVSIVSWYYKKYSQSLGGKTHIGSILPLIGLTVFMVIVVVKSSLALSLGLVGALSIVRFRTPIKEPEELGFLFLTIAIGLGFGAGYRSITILITFGILAYLYLTSQSYNKKKINGEYTLLVNISYSKFKECNDIIANETIALKVIRTELDDKIINVYYNISINNNFDLQNLIEKLKHLDNNSKIEFMETGVNW